MPIGNIDSSIPGAHRDYHDMLEVVRETFLKRVADEKVRLFRTNAPKLFDTYLDALPDSLRQEHNCNACRHFINRFGGLVTVDPETGKAKSALWRLDYPEFGAIARPLEAMRFVVDQARITGVFVSDEMDLGYARAGGFEHLAVKLPKHLVYTGRALTAAQHAAAKAEDFRIMMAAINSISPETLHKVKTFVASNALYRSEKIEGPLNFLNKLQGYKRGTTELPKIQGKNFPNIVWHEVAHAPTGFCRPRSSMIGTLIEDIEYGYSVNDVRRRFDAKMDATKYQRPVAQPKSGAIDAAEKLVDKLGVARSLERRHASLDELQLLWKPKPTKPVKKDSGVFANLREKPSAPDLTDDMPSVAITFRKFREKVLPHAQQIMLYLSRTNRNIGSIMTAVHDDAPPILQWDYENARNPFSHYVWQSDVAVTDIGLKHQGWHELSGIGLRAHMWASEEAFPHQGSGAFLVIKGAYESIRLPNAGAALFPETLKADFHGARMVVEAFAKSYHAPEEHEALVCRYLGAHTGDVYMNPVLLKVTQRDDTVVVYKVDRWD